MMFIRGKGESTLHTLGEYEKRELEGDWWIQQQDKLRKEKKIP